MSASESGAGSQTGGTGGPPKRSKAQNVINNVSRAAVNYVKSGGAIGMIGSAIGKQNAKNKTRNQANVELGLGGQDTIASLTNNNNNGSGNDTAPTQVAKNVGGKIIKAPTTAEVSQSGAADTDAYDNRKTKAKGRSMTIMTSSRGINRNNTLTLGKPSLLGR